MSADAAHRLRWWLLRVVAPVAALGGLAVLLVATRLDERALAAFYDSELGEFPLRRTWFFDGVVHEGGRYLAIAGALGALVLALAGGRLGMDRPWVPRLVYLAACALLTALVAGAWKELTHAPTPWNALRYGGDEPWPMDAQRLTLAVLFGAPGAHAASGFAWVSLYFVGASLGARSRVAWLAPGLLLGGLFSLSQLVRGAHPPSHHVWSLAIAWSVAAALAAAFRARDWMPWSERAPAPTAGAPGEPQRRAALPWLVAASGLFGGLVCFAIDMITNTFKQKHPHFDDGFEIFEVVLMGPGAALACYLLAERLRDVHERGLRREAAEREQRLQLLGRMAASVAHEVRNPLHTLRLIVDEQRLEVPGLASHPLRQEFESCLDRIDRVVELVYRLARPGSGERELVDLAGALREMVAMWERSSLGLARLELEQTPEHAYVRAPPEGVQIVLGNLLRNACEAGPPDEAIPLALVRENGAWVLSMRNRGSLRKPAAPRRVPPSGASGARSDGLGLGLVISRQIAADAGAQIDLSEQDGFVHCELRWPAAAEDGP